MPVGSSKRLRDRASPISVRPLAQLSLRRHHQQARDFKANLALTDAQPGQTVDSLTATARLDLTANNLAGAIDAFHRALALTPDDADLWLETARAANSLGGTGSQAFGQALLDGLNGYELTRTASKRADALAVLATSLAKNSNFRAALNAYKASLALASSREIQAAYLKLKSEQGFRITEHNVDADSATPRACVTFSESLVKTVDYAPFVTLNGQAPKALEAKDKQICVEGLGHGETYKISFRTGLPSSVDEVLDAPVSLDVYVKDRSQMVRFTGDSFVLPSTARRGIPLVSVNIENANLKLYRIGDRGIAPLLTSSQFLTQLDGYSAQRIQDESGELVWQGSIEIADDLNKDVVTSFPVDEAFPRASRASCADRLACRQAGKRVGFQGDTMVRRFRYRRYYLRRNRRAQRLYALARFRQADRRRRAATACQEQRGSGHRDDG
ncbi:hypothetical protein AJ87_43595 [Rhizobium yanglingense]|nr:hypothetical protein AJ87_43595 [Rhizobium yanglingense]